MDGTNACKLRKCFLGNSYYWLLKGNYEMKSFACVTKTESLCS